MKYTKQISNLCTPAFFYFGISAFVYILAIIQNIGKSDEVFCLGSLSCDVPSTVLIFAIKAMYIVFWTWVLNMMCKDGYPAVAWVLVLLPFIGMLLVMLSMEKVKKRESMGPLHTKLNSMFTKFQNLAPVEDLLKVKHHQSKTMPTTATPTPG